MNENHFNIPDNIYLKAVNMNKTCYFGFEKIDGEENKYKIVLYDKRNDYCKIIYYKNNINKLYQHYKDLRICAYMNEDDAKENIKNIQFIESPYLNSGIKCMELYKNDDNTYSLKFTGFYQCSTYVYVGINDKKEIHISENPENRIKFKILLID